MLRTRIGRLLAAGGIAVGALGVVELASMTPAAADTGCHNVPGYGLVCVGAGGTEHQVCLVLYQDDGTTKDFCIDWS